MKRVSGAASAKLETLGAGDVVTLEVEFNQEVIVEGEPMLIIYGDQPAVSHYELLIAMMVQAMTHRIAAHSQARPVFWQ